MPNSSSTIYARELIRLFVAALYDLNEGRPIPQSWSDALTDALRRVATPSKPGVKSTRTVTQREQTWARKMTAFRLDAQKRGISSGVTKYAEDLANEADPDGQSFAASDVFNAERKWRTLALSEIAPRLLEEDNQARDKVRATRVAEIERRQAGGESLDEILADPGLSVESFAMIRDHQKRGGPLGTAPAPLKHPTDADREGAVVQWIIAGLKQRIGNDLPVVVALNEASRRGLFPSRPRGSKRPRVKRKKR